jgi:hypothetical protein
MWLARTFLGYLRKVFTSIISIVIIPIVQLATLHCAPIGRLPTSGRLLNKLLNSNL